MGCGEWQCPHCGAWNDPGEKCDCEQKESPESREAIQDKQNNYMLIIRQEGGKCKK